MAGFLPGREEIYGVRIDGGGPAVFTIRLAPRGGRTSVRKFLGALSFVEPSGLDHDGLRCTANPKTPGALSMKESIFELFNQVDSTTQRSHEGMGVGLYLVRQLMKAQDGSVRVMSGPDGGSKFILTFARSKVPLHHVDSG